LVENQTKINKEKIRIFLKDWIAKKEE